MESFVEAPALQQAMEPVSLDAYSSKQKTDYCWNTSNQPKLNYYINKAEICKAEI